MILFHFLAVIIFFGSRFHNCTNNFETRENLSLTKPYLSLRDSLLQATLVSLYSVPVIRSTVFANINHLFDESGALIRPDCIKDGIYLGLVRYFIFMEKIARGATIADESLQLDQFFDMTLFSVAKVDRFLSALVSSFPETVQEIFSISLSIPALKRNHLLKRLFYDLKLSDTAKESVFVEFGKSGRELVAGSKVLMFSVERASDIDENCAFNKISCIANTSIVFGSKRYILVAKLGRIFQPGSDSSYATSSIRSEVDGVLQITTTLHVCEQDNMQVQSEMEFNLEDIDSELLIYVLEGTEEVGAFSFMASEDLENLYAAFANFSVVQGNSLPAFAFKKAFKIGEMMEYFRSPNLKIDDVNFLGNTTVLTRIVTSELIPRLASIGEQNLKMFLFMSSSRVELEGGENYSFQRKYDNGLYHAVELVLSVLESNRRLVKSVFESDLRDGLNSNLAVILFQMLIGKENIVIKGLVDIICQRGNLNLAAFPPTLDGHKFRYYISNVIRILGPNFIAIPVTKIVKYYGYSSDDVLSFSSTDLPVSVPSISVIPSGQADIDGAWIDLNRFNDSNRYRYIFSAPKAELFFVSINRSFALDDKPMIDSRGNNFNSIKFNGKAVKLNSVIAQNPNTQQFIHVNLKKEGSNVFVFSPGQPNTNVSYSETTLMRIVENFSMVLLFQNIRDDGAVESSLLISQVPKSVYSIVFQSFIKGVRQDKRARET